MSASLPSDWLAVPTQHGQLHFQYVPPSRRGYTVLKDILPQLRGRMVDDVVTKGYIHALRPSYVRICRDSCTLDSCSWRVTIWLCEQSDLIDRVDQEVEVGLYDDVQHGGDLQCLLEGRSRPVPGQRFKLDFALMKPPENPPDIPLHEYPNTLTSSDMEIGMSVGNSAAVDQVHFT